MRTFVFALCVFFLGILSANGSDPQSTADNGPFLFSYFRDNGQDGLHLAWSKDGLVWKPLNSDKPLTKPVVGEKLMRDPSIVQGPDGVFHMVWSTGWWDTGFGYASSKDLIHWTAHKNIPVNADTPGAKNTWAPDLFYDAPTKRFVIVYSTTVPGRFPETEKGGDHNHRPYFVTTKDFQTFSKPEVFFNPGYNSIDGTLFEANGKITLIYKDERPGHKTLHATTTTEIGKPFAPATGSILDRDWVEGPTVLKVGKVWRLYYDCYTKGHYGAAESADGVTWRDITPSLQIPKGVRHGTAFAVSPQILENLLKLSGE
jgi:hypothetical protein